MENAAIGLVVVAIALWLWRDSLRAREQATRVCVRACTDNGLQFLDGTVALIRMRPRLIRGRIVLRRDYAFEYTRTGAERETGVAIMRGSQLEHLVLGASDGGPPPEKARVLLFKNGSGGPTSPP